MRCVAAACLVVFAVCMPAALAQTPTIPEFLAPTDRGNLIEIKPADDVPTTDIVSSPYVEFQRVGGLIASGNKISEAAQYNTVSSGITYIINNWARGRRTAYRTGHPWEARCACPKVAPVTILTYVSTPDRHFHSGSLF